MTDNHTNNNLQIIRHNTSNAIIIGNIITNIINRLILRTTFDTLKLHTTKMRQQ